VTRDYVLEYDAGAERAPLLSVFGGKITTYRRLAEEAMDLLAPGLGGVRPAWTAAAALPGGDIANADFDGFLTKLQRRLPWLPAELARRYARAYGTRVERLLGNARSLGDLGEAFGAGLYEAEIEYLVRNEWAASAEDVLWRRTKLGLHVAPETAQRVATRLPALAGARSNHEIHHAADA
jgi:glycerol-3-phosphate dehydrogenase